MDLALYVSQAVLVEGRSVRDLARATGRSKSWVHRHAALYREGRALKGQGVLMLICDLDVRVIAEDGTRIRRLTLDPSIDYQPIRADTV